MRLRSSLELTLRTWAGPLRRREAEMENRGRESRLLGSAVLLLWDEFPGYM